MQSRKLDKDKHSKGKVAEAAALFRLTLLGVEVFGSPFDGDAVDWVVRTRQNRLLQIQVRLAQTGQHGLPYVKLCHSHGRHEQQRYKPGDFDILIAYDLFTDTCYVWTWEDLQHLKTMVTVSPEAAERWDKVDGG